MKGGKAGRKRTSSARGTGQKGSDTGRPTKGGAKRAPSSAPKKGARKNPERGGISSTGDDS
jgi:hypothetical protein